MSQERLNESGWYRSGNEEGKRTEEEETLFFISQFTLTDMQVCIYDMAQQVRLSVPCYLCLSGNFYICIYIRYTLCYQTPLRSILMCHYFLYLFKCICVGSGFAYTKTAKPEITYIVDSSQTSLLFNMLYWK